MYQQVIIDMPELSAEQRAILPIYTSVVTALGLGDQSYLDVQNRQSAVTGGLGAYSSVKGAIEDVQEVKGVIVFSGKALNRNYQLLADLLKETLETVRFDESERIRELVAQMRARREQSVTNNGHSLAMGVASSGMSPTARMAYELGGMAGIKALKSLDDQLEEGDGSELNKLVRDLKQIHEKVIAQNKQYLVVSESDNQ